MMKDDWISNWLIPLSVVLIAVSFFLIIKSAKLEFHMELKHEPPKSVKRSVETRLERLEQLFTNPEPCYSCHGVEVEGER